MVSYVHSFCSGLFDELTAHDVTNQSGSAANRIGYISTYCQQELSYRKQIARQLQKH